MKKMLCLILTIAVFAALKAQKLNEQEYYKIPTSKSPDSFFLDKKFCSKYGLDPKSKDNLSRVWFNYKSQATIQMLFDIRYWCESEDEAKKYLGKNLLLLSEGGMPNNDHISVSGASDLHVYNESPQLHKSIDSLKLDSRQMNFIFRIKNIVLKIFVASSKKYTSEQLAVFARTAAALVTRALKGG